MFHWNVFLELVKRQTRCEYLYSINIKFNIELHYWFSSIEAGVILLQVYGILEMYQLFNLMLLFGTLVCKAKYQSL